MDIRNIDMAPFEAVYKEHSTRIIDYIFTLQKSLLDKYIGVEKLPQYPIEINAPNNQIMIKDFIARVTEELGEAYESYLWLYNWVRNGMEADDEPTAIQKLYNFNEEIADAIHFLIETYIFTGITSKDLNDFMVNLGFPEVILDDRYDTYNHAFNSVIPYQGLGPDCPAFINPEQNILTQGGRLVSPAQLVGISTKLWNVTYFLQLARNALKNKPWKQSHMLSDHKVYRYNMMLALNELIYFTRYVGINERGFLAIYWAKNQVNCFRISSHY